MQAEIIDDCEFCPHGHTIVKFKKGQIVDGFIAERAVGFDLAKPRRGPPPTVIFEEAESFEMAVMKPKAKRKAPAKKAAKT